ncbi:Fanconi anemia core complex-associated protein 100-like [Glandiceps talaboti]
MFRGIPIPPKSQAPVQLLRSQRNMIMENYNIEAVKPNSEQLSMTWSMAILKLSCPIKCSATQCRQDNGVILWCCTVDGKLYNIKVNNYLTKKKRKQRNTAYSKTEDTEQNTSNQDIFTGLLSDDDLDLDIEMMSEKVIEIGHENMCMDVGKIEAVMPYANYIITLGKQSQGWCVAIYELNNTDSHVLQEKTNIFRTVIPYDKKRYTKPSTASPDACNEKCLLMCAISGDMAEEITVFSKQMLIVDCELFSLLFGADRSLLDCLVILVGLPHGRIVYIPIKNISQSSDLNFDLAGKVQSLPHVWIQSGLALFPLYNIEESVINIHGLNLPNERTAELQEAANRKRDDHCSNAIVLVGEGGKIVVIHHWKGHLDFTEYIMSGPVTSSSLSQTGYTLLCSTPTDLYSVYLVDLENNRMAKMQDDESQHNTLLPSVLTPTGRGVSRIIGITNNANSDENGNIHLSAIKNNGQIIGVTIEIGNHGDDPILAMSSSTAGQKMKEALTGINNMVDKLSDMREKSDLQNTVLTELNHAAHIVCCVESGNKKDNSESQFACSAVVNTQDRGHKYQYGVTLNLQNNSHKTLNFAWTWLVYCQANEDNTIQTYSKAVSLNQFHPGSFVEMYIALVGNDVQLPVNIIHYLHFNIQRLLDNMSTKEDPIKSNINITKTAVCLGIGSSCIDVLHFITPLQRPSIRSSEAVGMETRIQKIRWKLDKITNKRLGCVRSKEECTSVCTYSTTILISTVNRIDKTDHGKAATDTRNIECQILELLLCNNPALTDMTSVDTSTVLQLQTPHGQHITLQCNKVTSGGGDVIELIISTASLCLLCQLHQAILQQLQTLTRTKPVTIRRLQQEVKRIQKLQCELKILEDKLLDCHDASCHDFTLPTELIDIYSKLRTNSLLIF